MMSAAPGTSACGPIWSSHGHQKAPAWLMIVSVSTDAAGLVTFSRGGPVSGSISLVL